MMFIRSFVVVALAAAQALAVPLLAVRQETPALKAREARPAVGNTIILTSRYVEPSPLEARQAPGSIPAEVAVKSDGNTITVYRREDAESLLDRKSTRLNSSHSGESRMPSSA